MDNLNSRKGYTLLEVMIVVLVLGILLTIAIPNFMKARESSRTKSCIANLHVIQNAKFMFAFQNSVEQDHSCTWDEILPYIHHKPICPESGEYQLKAIKDSPTCSIDNHEL